MFAFPMAKLPNRPAATYREFLFRAEWRSTSLVIRVPGKNEADAVRRAENMVKRMLGGVYCMGLHFLGEAQ